MKNIDVENLGKNYSVKKMTEEDSMNFSSNVMQSIKNDDSVQKVHLHKRTIFSKYSMIGSSVAAALVGALLFFSSVDNSKQAALDELEATDIMAILNNLGEDKVLVNDDSDILYQEILLAGDLQEKL
ncbi:MAG: hypothetical protein PF692_06630 [Kiritimatiellae bacterium]|jgi:hypothetical protein|nr:hypothetical protein [Kiritimatiellia bacterium]